MTPRRLTVIATGPSGAPDELDPLRAAGHEVIIGRPLDMPGRRAYAESELIAQASGAWTERVEDPAALPDAIARALKAVREDKRQALLNVICKKP